MLEIRLEFFLPSGKSFALFFFFYCFLTLNALFEIKAFQGVWGESQSPDAFDHFSHRKVVAFFWFFSSIKEKNG